MNSNTELHEMYMQDNKIYYSKSLYFYIKLDIVYIELIDRKNTDS